MPPDMPKTLTLSMQLWVQYTIMGKHIVYLRHFLHAKTLGVRSQVTTAMTTIRDTAI